MAEPMVQMERVHFSYPHQKPLFESLDFSVFPGRAAGLLGKNGAGKTTLLKLAAGLLFPHAGTVTLFGRSAERRHPASLERIAYLPEHIEIPPISLERYTNLQAGYFPRFDRGQMQRYLQRFSVEADSHLRELSHGQQKKVLVAAALACGADLLFLDEPTNAMDIPSKQVFRHVVEDAVGLGRSVIVSTHQVKDVENLIDPILVLEGGRIVFESSMESIRERLEMRRFETAADAQRAGALASDAGRHGTIAVVPRGSSTGGETEEPLDLELLFHAAVTRPEDLKTV